MPSIYWLGIGLSICQRAQRQYQVFANSFQKCNLKLLNTICNIQNDPDQLCSCQISEVVGLTWVLQCHQVLNDNRKMHTFWLSICFSLCIQGLWCSMIISIWKFDTIQQDELIIMLVQWSWAQVHKIVDLSFYSNREALWHLEVIEAHQLFYRHSINGHSYDATTDDGLSWSYTWKQILWCLKEGLLLACENSHSATQILQYSFYLQYHAATGQQIEIKGFQNFQSHMSLQWQPLVLS